MKKYAPILLLIAAILIVIVFIKFFTGPENIKIYTPTETSNTYELRTLRLRDEAQELNKFIEENDQYNKDIAFLIDMRIPSEKYRFFIYDLQNDSVIERGIVAHGIGSETGIHGELKFSNIPDSKTTSLGKFAIGKSYYGQFGKAYKLHGLDTTNNKAFERYIVLHYYKLVPYEENENPIVRSEGCPMVSEPFFTTLKKYIDASEKKILLHIYY